MIKLVEQGMLETSDSCRVSTPEKADEAITGDFIDYLPPPHLNHSNGAVKYPEIEPMPKFLKMVLKYFPDAFK